MESPFQSLNNQIYQIYDQYSIFVIFLMSIPPVIVFLYKLYNQDNSYSCPIPFPGPPPKEQKSKDLYSLIEKCKSLIEEKITSEIFTSKLNNYLENLKYEYSETLKDIETFKSLKIECKDGVSLNIKKYEEQLKVIIKELISLKINDDSLLEKQFENNKILIQRLREV